MIKFWVKKKNRSYLQVTAIGVIGSFLLSLVSPTIISAKQSESKQAGQASQVRHSTALRAGSGRALQLRSGQAALTTGQLSHYKMDHFLEKYLENLKELKKAVSEDEEFSYEVGEVISILKDRLTFKGPIEKDGMVSFLGAYEEDRHTIHFLVEVGTKNEENAKVASISFREELNAILGTLRQQPGTFETGKISILARIALLNLWGGNMAQGMNIPHIRIASQEEITRFKGFKKATRFDRLKSVQSSKPISKPRSNLQAGRSLGSTSLKQEDHQASPLISLDGFARRFRPSISLGTGSRKTEGRREKQRANNHKKSAAEAALLALSALHEGTISELFLLLLRKAKSQLNEEEYEDFIKECFNALERILKFETKAVEVSFELMEKGILNLTDLEIKSLHKIAPLLLPNFLAKYLALIFKPKEIESQTYYEEIKKAIKKKFKERVEALKKDSSPIAGRIRSFKIIIYDDEDFVESDKKYVLAHLTISKSRMAELYLHKRLIWELMLMEEDEQKKTIQALIERELMIQSELQDGVEFDLAHQRVLKGTGQNELLEFSKKVARKILEHEPYDEAALSKQSDSLQPILEPRISSIARVPRTELKKELKMRSAALGYSSTLIDEIIQFDEVVRPLQKVQESPEIVQGDSPKTIAHLNQEAQAELYKGYFTSLKLSPNLLGSVAQGAIAATDISKRLVQRILKESTLRNSLQAGLLSLTPQRRIGNIELFSKNGRVFDPDELNTLLYAYQNELLLNRLADSKEMPRQIGEGLFTLLDYLLGSIGQKNVVSKIAIRGKGELARSIALAAIQKMEEARVVAIDLGQEILVKEQGFTKSEIRELQSEVGIARLKSSTEVRVLNNEARNRIFSLEADLVVLADHGMPVDHLSDEEGTLIPIRTKMVIDLNNGLTITAEQILKDQVPVIPPLLARIGEMESLLNSMGKTEFTRRIKYGAAKVLAAARELAQNNGKSVEELGLYLRDAAYLASVRGILESNMEKEMEWLTALLGGKVEVEIPSKKSRKSFKGIEPIDFERFLKSLKKRSKVPRDFKGLVLAFQKSESSLALKNLLYLMKKDSPHYYLSYRFILSRILEKLNHPIFNQNQTDLDKYLKSLHSFHTAFFQNPDFFLEQLKSLEESLDLFLENKERQDQEQEMNEASQIANASVRGLQALHSGGLIELILMLLEKHRFLKDRKVVRQTFFEFFSSIEEAFGERGIHGKEIPKKDPDSSMPFELVEQFILSLTLDDLISIDLVNKKILSRFLKNYLWNLLSNSHRFIVLRKNEKDYLGYTQESFMENLEFYGITDIKLVEVRVHENDDLLKNPSTFILAPFIDFENGKAVFYIHRDFLNAIMNLEEDEPLKMLERMVHRELELYRVMNYPRNKAERELDFDSAHRYILEYQEQLILYNFAVEFVANLSQYRPLPITDTIEKYQYYVKPEVLNGMEELLQDPELIESIALLSMVNLGHLEVIRIEHDRTYLRIYFKDGSWFTLRLDYHQPGVELHLAGGDATQRFRFYKYTKMLVSLLSDIFYVREKARMAEEVKRFKERMIQQFEQETAIDIHPWIIEHRHLLFPFGMSDSLLTDIFQFGELSAYPILLGTGENQKRYLGYHLALVGSSPVGKIMAGMLALPESDPKKIRATLEKILIKRALQVGFLHRNIQGNAGRIELFQDLKPQVLSREDDILQMNSTFSDELILGHSVDKDIENRSISRGIIRILRHLFGEDGIREDLPVREDEKQKPREIVITEMTPLGERIVELLINNGYKVVGIGFGEGVVTKKDGFTQGEISWLLHYQRTKTLEQSLQFRPHGMIYSKREGKDPLLEIVCDALILLGDKGEIKAKGRKILDRYGNKTRIKAASLIELTDRAITQEAINLLEEEAIQVVPHFLATIHQVFLDVNLGGEIEDERLSLNRTVNEALRKIFTLYRLRRMEPSAGKKATLKETAIYFALKGLLTFHLEDDLKIVQRARSNIDSKHRPSRPKNFKTFTQVLRSLKREAAELALTHILILMRFKDYDLYFNYRLVLGRILDLMLDPLVLKNEAAAIAYWDTLVSYSMDPIAENLEYEEQFKLAKNKKLFISHLLVERLNLLKSDIESYIEKEGKKSESASLDPSPDLAGAPNLEEGDQDHSLPSPVSIHGSLIAGFASLTAGFLSGIFLIWLVHNAGSVPVLLSLGAVLVMLHFNVKFSTKQVRWMPVWLEAVLNFYLFIPPCVGAGSMVHQAVQIRLARTRANRVRDGPSSAQAIAGALGIPSQGMLLNFKKRIESEYEITLIDDGKDSKEIAYVNRKNPEELQANIVHVDLFAFYYLPSYLQKTILRDHELLHLRNNLGEFNAYLRQILNSFLPALENPILAVLVILLYAHTLFDFQAANTRTEQGSALIEEKQSADFFSDEFLPMEQHKEKQGGGFFFAGFPKMTGSRGSGGDDPFEKIRDEFKKNLQNLINFMSRADDFSNQPPDAFVVIGSPYLTTYLEFAERWKEIYQRDGKQIPIVIAGGRGSGTIPLIEKMIKKYGKDISIPVKGEDGLFFASLEEAKRNQEVHESDLLRFVLMDAGVNGDIIIDEDEPSVNTESNFINSFNPILERMASIENPRIALVSSPPLLMRAKPTAKKMWENLGMPHWQVLKFNAHDLDVTKLNDQYLIELASNLIGYPLSYKDHYPDLRYSHELFGVEKRYEALGMRPEEDTPFQEASQALLAAQESFARYLSGLKFYHDKSVHRLIPIQRTFEPDQHEHLHGFVHVLVNPSLHSEPMPQNSPVEDLDIRNLNFLDFYNALSRLRQILSDLEADSPVGFIELKFTSFAELWQIFEQKDILTLIDLIREDPQVHVVVIIKSAEIKAQPNLYNRLKELGILISTMKDLDDFEGNPQEQADIEDEGFWPPDFKPFNLAHAGFWFLLTGAIGLSGFGVPIYMDLGLGLNWIFFLIGSLGAWSGLVIGSHFFLAGLARWVGQSKEPVILNRKLEKYIYDELTSRMNGENITLWFKSQKEMNRLALEKNKVMKKVSRKFPLIGNYELTDSEKKAVYLSDWLVKESNNKFFNWLRALLLPMILDHIEDRLKSQNQFEDAFIHVSKPFNPARNNPARIFKSFQKVSFLLNSASPKNPEQAVVPNAIEQVARALGHVVSLFKFLLNDIQESKVLFVVNIGDLPFSIDGIQKFMEHVEGKKMAALAVVTDNGQLMKVSEVENLLKGKMDLKHLFIIDQPSEGDLTTGPKFSLKEVLEKVQRFESTKGYTLKVIKVNDFWSFEGIGQKELLRLLIEVDVAGDLFGQGFNFKSFSELIRSAMEMESQVLSIRSFTESQ